MKKFKKLFFRVVIFLAAVYLLLLVPDGADTDMVTAGKKPFVWNKDTFWLQMEAKFVAARQMTTEQQDSVIKKLLTSAMDKLNQVADSALGAGDARLADIENNFFDYAVYAAARPLSMSGFLHYGNQLRDYIKKQSCHWNTADTAVKNALYTLLYGMRAATEEAMLQTGIFYDAAPAVEVQEEMSAAPFTTIFGVKVHSGDLLVSRGGAEVSALISRGNDYPGNFSHVALIYVDEKTNQPYLIEAHIEKGVALSSVEQYVSDKKLRFMVLRLRNDLPVMQKDPLLPHKAAKAMYAEAQRRHIPYDFKMDYYDTSAMFCSEVASYAYKKQGVLLWQHISTISSPGVVNWLHDFGVVHFVTQMPSDLEYDPQLAVVAEWRDDETLFKDHIDNAAMDALLEKADSGQTISFNRWMLPVVRVLKGYCWIKNRFGQEGLIPEGMNATRALKNQTFVAMHEAVSNYISQKADAFFKEKSYRPPYWQLVKFAREGVKDFFKD